MKDPDIILRRAGKTLLTIAAGITSLFILVVAYGMLIERHWLVVRTLNLNPLPGLKVVHITDIHHKGDRQYLSRVVDTINRLSPDIACITGDLVEESGFMDEALTILSGIRCPIYGIPGNHDYWSRYPFEKIAVQFRRTGGLWLCDTNVIIRNGSVEISGSTGSDAKTAYSDSPAIRKRILLVHYPSIAGSVAGSHKYDLILSGHTHGGQVRLPYGGPVLPDLVDGNFDRGLFKTSAGPLYVNPGIGTFYHDIRLFCRPEITVIHL